MERRTNNSADQSGNRKNRLAAYALAAGATLAAGQTAQADIIHTTPPGGGGKFTDPTLPLTLGPGVTTFGLDLNHDGQPDFNLIFTPIVPGSDLLIAAPLGKNKLVQGARHNSAGSYVAAALNAGAPISSGRGFGGKPGQFGSGSVLASRTTGGQLFGSWRGANGKFLGLAFFIGTDTKPNFGWARLSVNANDTGTLLDYAYETVPGRGITAGQLVEVPEPNSLGLLALGAVGVLAWRRWRRSPA